MPVKKISGKPTIDVELVVIRTETESYAVDTSSKIVVEPQTETTDAIKLIKGSSGKLLGQKPAITTITGHQITWTDNIFIPQVVVLLQGGTYTDNGDGTATYTPPVSGSTDKGKVFEMDCYSANYDVSGTITGYEKITYPNCKGSPVTINMEDNVFRIPEYTINSAPKSGQPPYTIAWVAELPEIAEEPPSEAGSGISEVNMMNDAELPEVRKSAAVM